MPLVKLAWPVIMEQVPTLFDTYRKFGNHPAPFWRGDVRMMDKKAKDMATIARYRPI